MIVYSVTVSIDREIHQDWITWMTEEHIPDVMNTGFFTDHNMFRLLDPVVDESQITYTIQYFCETINHYYRYQEEVAPRLQKEHTERYRDKFVAFRTILQNLGPVDG